MCEERFKQLENEVLQMIKEANYPMGHPFLDYPKTPESNVVIMLILIYDYTNDKDMIRGFIDKCNGNENGDYSFEIYLQGVSEVTWLYYLIVGLKNNQDKMKASIKGENYKVIDNPHIFEYSILLDKPDCVLSFEVKSLSCDPFEREERVELVDGQKLIKPYFPSLKDSDYLDKFPDHYVLKKCTHYRQVNLNLKRIKEKCEGNRLIQKKLYCFGVMFVTASTSFEEFYSYLFNKKYGLYSRFLSSKIDALILISLDAKNDVQFNNLYESQYVQTMLLHPCDELHNICQALRLDNYIAVGNSITEPVLEKGQEEYGFFKMLKRDGIVNIIPSDATEEGINEYIQRVRP